MKSIEAYHDFDEVLDLLSLPTPIHETIRAAYRKNYKQITTRSEEAYAKEAPHFPVRGYKPFTRAMVVIDKLTSIRKKYLESGIPEEVFKDTISDVSLRIRLYTNKNKKIGLDIDSVVWLRHLFNMEIFKLGSLQFQLFEMIYLDESYMTYEEEWRTNLPTGSPVLNVHIQEEADLTPEAIDSSFVQAHEFFKKYFPQHSYQAFLCYSWLLYPDMKQLLPDGSKIALFANRFTLIGSVQDNEEAIQRIYGHRYRAKKDYPQETSLQRRGLNQMKLFGEGCGVILREELRMNKN